MDDWTSEEVKTSNVVEEATREISVLQIAVVVADERILDIGSKFFTQTLSNRCREINDDGRVKNLLPISGSRNFDGWLDV